MPQNADLQDLLSQLARMLPELSARYRVASLGVFGSFARQKQRPGSDLDLLVTFHETPSLFTFIKLENHLSDALGQKVDLVMESALKPAIGKRIRAEVIRVE